MKNDYIWILILLVALGLFGALLFSSPDAPELGYYPVDVGGGSITIEDQNQLQFVDFDAELVAPGFITIHKTITEAPAEIIGVTEYLEPGVYQGLKVFLNEEMAPGYKYAAILHVDDGDGVFVVDLDFPVMTNGEVVRPYFLAIPEAERILEPTEE
ncbi:MAG: hypothetical protein ABH826_01795 [Patescibacteria group bacterium]|nr:hypothetical protein [Patescibacteria group bacterium]